jgi:F0F1-type ATP synthase membrane subunit b/b'
MMVFLCCCFGNARCSADDDGFFVLSPTSRHVYWSKSDNSIVDRRQAIASKKQEARQSHEEQQATSNAEQQSTKRTKTAAATIATHAHSSVTNFHLHFKP